MIFCGLWPLGWVNCWAKPVQNSGNPDLAKADAMLDKSAQTVKSTDAARINEWHGRNEVVLVDVGETSEI